MRNLFRKTYFVKMTTSTSCHWRVMSVWLWSDVVDAIDRLVSDIEGRETVMVEEVVRL